MFPDAPGLFGARRRHDNHTGIDLYTNLGTEVVAVEDGTVVHIEGFTGPNADDPSPWWNDTQAILIEGASGIVNYGEVTPRVKVGDVVKAGQVIAVIDTAVLRKFKGRPMMMLHLELMVPGVREIIWWRLDEPQPEVLLDPTDKLREAAGHRLRHFSLDTYDGKSYLPAPEVIGASIAVIHCQGKILLLQRGPEDRSYPNGWCFPGGSENEGETPRETILRELFEETKMTAPNLIYRGVSESPLPTRNRVFFISIYEDRVTEIPVVELSSEHQAFGWFSPEEALKLPLAGPTTTAIVKGLFHDV